MCSLRNYWSNRHHWGGPQAAESVRPWNNIPISRSEEEREKREELARTWERYSTKVQAAPAVLLAQKPMSTQAAPAGVACTYGSQEHQDGATMGLGLPSQALGDGTWPSPLSPQHAPPLPCPPPSPPPSHRSTQPPPSPPPLIPLLLRFSKQAHKTYLTTARTPRTGCHTHTALSPS